MKTKRDIFFKIIIFIMFAGVSYYSWNTLFWVELNIIETLFFISVALFFSCITFLFILEPFSKFSIVKLVIKFIGWILSSIMLIGTAYQVLVFPIITLVMIAGAQVIIWEGVFYFFSVDDFFRSIVVYEVYLVTIVTFAYYGKSITSMFYNFISNDDSNFHRNTGKLIENFVTILFFRRRAYEIGLFLTILSTIDRIKGSPLVNVESWIMISKFSFEVFITFIAIDTYYINFMKKNNTL